MHALRRQRVRVGEGVEQHGGEVTVHDRNAVLRTTAVGGLEPVQERLADEVLLVVLVDARPTEDRVPHDRVDPRVLEGRAGVARWIPSELGRAPR